MSSTYPQIPFTYEDYKSLTATSDQRHELIDGELYVTPAPTTTHQFVAQNLLLMLMQHVRARGLGLARILGTRRYGKPAVYEGTDRIASVAVRDFEVPLHEVFRRD